MDFRSWTVLNRGTTRINTFSFLSYRIIIFLFVSPLLLPTTAAAQNDTVYTPVDMRDRVSVFLDCNSCDNTFIRQEINFIDYVRDPLMGDVHLFITQQRTASGGRRFNLAFIGLRKYEGINNELSYISVQTNTEDEERRGLIAVIKLGMVPYLAHTSLSERMTISISNRQVVQDPVEDSWNNWIFEMYGGLNFEKESSLSALDIRYGLQVDHITEKWRIQMRPYFNYNQRNFINENKVIKSVLHRNGFQGKVVRSLSENWSVGVFSDAISNTYQNIDFGYSIAPALEYSFLPYAEALNREFTVAYSIGFDDRRYLQATIYDKLSETLYYHELRIGVRIRQPWGSVTAELEGSNYLHDPSKNRISFDGRVSFRLFKGLFIDFDSELDMVRDQISLPKGDVSLEDILLKQRQLATSYEISFSVGLSYRFGSIYNNVVNTRL